MAFTGDRILLVENDPEISDIIARQALRSVGYQVDVVQDSSAAIKSSLQTPPDLIIVDLNIPGLSAKDMLVVLTSQGVNTPLLVIASKGQEQDIIQAFRLGAADYLLWPARDAEVVSVVERARIGCHHRYWQSGHLHHGSASFVPKDRGWRGTRGGSRHYVAACAQ